MGIARFRECLRVLNSRLRRVDGKTLTEVSLSAIAVLVAFQAASYFTLDPVLSVYFWGEPHVGYYLSSVPPFYDREELPLPTYLDDAVYDELFRQDDHMPAGRVALNGAVSNLVLARALANGQSDNWFHKDRSSKIERDLSDLRYTIHMYMNDDPRKMYSEGGVRALLQRAKQHLTSVDYFTWLCAVLDSREVQQDLMIMNEGDVDMKNVRLTIPAPQSKVTHSRIGNILDYELMGKILVDVLAEQDRLVVILPFLKVGESANIRLRCRENKLQMSDLSYAFVADPKLDARRMLFHYILIFIALAFLRWYFRGQVDHSLGIVR